MALREIMTNFDSLIETNFVFQGNYDLINWIDDKATSNLHPYKYSIVPTRTRVLFH